MSDDAGKASEEAAAAVVDAPKETEAVDLRTSDVLADPVVDEAPAGDDVVVPADGEPAAAVVDATPADDAGGKAVEPVVEDAPAPAIEQVTDADGNVTAFKLGKYQAATLEELVVKVENGRRNAEKLVGKKKEELVEDPFLLSDEDFDEFEIVDDSDFGQQIGTGVLAALQQAGIVPQQAQQQDQYVQHAQVLQVAQNAIDNPSTTDQEFRSVLAALIQADPNDAQSRDAVLQEWGQRNPAAAATEAAQIQHAFQQFHAEQQQAAQMHAWQEQQQAAQQQQAEVVKGVEEFRFGQQTFVAEHPDWQARDAGMKQWLQQNAWLMDSAKQQPLVGEGGRRSRAEAVRNVLKMAYDASAPVAGVAGGVSEQGGNMTSVTPTSTDTTIAAAEQQRIADQRELAGLETGAVVDDVTISVAQQSPPGLAETDTFDLIGLRQVGS